MLTEHQFGVVMALINAGLKATGAELELRQPGSFEELGKAIAVMRPSTPTE